MHLIRHPDEYRTGTRVLMLRGRHKDGIEHTRSFERISHCVEQFNQVLIEFATMAQPGERIYAYAGARSMPKAIREFKRRQLDADHDDDPQRFYRCLQDRWISVLMASTSQAEKLWLFDCDSADDANRALGELREHYSHPERPYWYQTKSGIHIITRPFNRTPISRHVRKLIHANPIMLWGFN